MSLFGYVVEQPHLGLGGYTTFEDFGGAMLLVLQMATSEGWTTVMRACMVAEPLCGARAGVQFIAPDDVGVTDGISDQFRFAFAEDKVILEAIQTEEERHGTRGRVGLDIDGSAGLFRRMVTERVRDDIVQELGLADPEVLVGFFDRPNLAYKVMIRDRAIDQLAGILDRHPSESGIIYCISRRDVENTSEQLNSRGYRTSPYHAGLSDQLRKSNQEAFIGERIDTIVATVAFGMGIDKSNVRYVIHAAMPKSLEGYQQETGRAGRDGLEAECCLLYTGGDYGRWRAILEGSDTEPTEGAWQSLRAMHDFAGSVVCRHASLVEYFGQSLDGDNCGACDVCLGELDQVEDPLVVSQKILSSVIRQDQRFGADYTVKVLRGSTEQRVLDNGHDRLSTYGLLREHDVRAVRGWVEQLVAQGFLSKTGEYNVLQVTGTGRGVLTGEETPRLLKPAKATGARKSKVHEDSWEGVDRGLFERLRDLRRQLAEEKSVPAYVVFGDASLRDMTRRRPSTLSEFLEVHGVGEKKAAVYGELFLAVIGGGAI